VEKAFGLVKAWLRDHEAQATQNPVAWINRAFQQFEIGGPSAGSINGHWNIYFRMREIYEEENA
jgi:hypothetical protein